MCSKTTKYGKTTGNREVRDRSIKNSSTSQTPVREAAEFHRSFQKHIGALLESQVLPSPDCPDDWVLLFKAETT